MFQLKVFIIRSVPEISGMSVHRGNDFVVIVGVKSEFSFIQLYLCKHVLG
jgi:hypothetical protein